MGVDYPTSEREVRLLADTIPLQEAAKRIVRWADDADPRALKALRAMLQWRANDTYAKHDIPRLVALALLAHGPEGVAVLSEAAAGSPGFTYPTVVIQTLWLASRGDVTTIGQVFSSPIDVQSLSTRPIDASTQRAADKALNDLIVDALLDEDLLESVIGALWMITVAGQHAVRGFLERITEASIKLTPSLIRDFEDLVESAAREEVYQQFLSEHPVLLDPLAARVIPKQRLGVQHATDFALERHDARWLLVEIEKPQDRIFTDRNDLSAAFTHGFGQVLDFQRWVEAHAEYARHLMPAIASPRGVLIIGRRDRLQEQSRAKLRRFVANSASIDVCTFDDLLANARTLFKSLHRSAEAAR